MAPRHVVVDGSNLATEGRSLPSLAQLDEAVRAYKEEWPDDDVLVVVDASFSYRIDESEREMFEGAEAAGEVVSPPAGAIGRGDGFLLRIADRTNAVVLSNDSFQEFHGEYPWLFDEGRLVGGKPVPGVGWIFTPRSPVRGPKSRVAVRDAKSKRRAASTEPVAQAIAEATEAVSAPEPTTTRRSGRRRGRSSAAPEPEAVNEPLPFITFIAEHHLGTEVDGTVDSFTSHGAFIVADGARCYAPVVGLGDPPPRSAKDVLKRGETRTFVVQALDPPRRGIELALPGLAKVAGAPTEETVEAEIDVGAKPARRRGVRKAAPESRPEPAAERVPDPVAAAAGPSSAPVEPVAEPVDAPAEPVAAGPRRNTVRRSRATPEPAATAAPAPAAEVPSVAPTKRVRKASAKKAVAELAAEPTADTAPAPPGRAPARKAARKAAAATGVSAPAGSGAAEKAPTKRAAARKTPAEKVATKRTPTAEKAPAKAAAKKAAAKKVGSTPVRPPAEAEPVTDSTSGSVPPKRPVARKAAAKKSVVVAGDGPPTKASTKAPAKKDPAKKSLATKAAKKSLATKAAKKPGTKAAAKKAAAKKAAAKKAAAPTG